jgi:Zn-dependent membrane protease YugP
MILSNSFFLFLLPGLFLGLYAQYRLSSAYNRYIQEPLASGLSGAEAAREILDRNGLESVAVHEVAGHLTDHYDPMKKALFLSSENFRGRSIAAVGVAAHETGHALQHKAAYAPLQIRMALVPATKFASQASMYLFLGAMILGYAKIALAGVVIYGIITAFQLITLPVEYNASSRAKEQLLKMGIVQQRESQAVSKVLSAAALTYVAAMVQSLLYLLQFVLLARQSDRD